MLVYFQVPLSVYLMLEVSSVRLFFPETRGFGGLTLSLDLQVYCSLHTFRIAGDVNVRENLTATHPLF